MIYELSQSFGFDAAHTLLRHVPVNEYAASARVHGHSYLARVAVAGERVNGGMLAQPKREGRKEKPQSLDLFYLREAIAEVRNELDHRMLNDVPGLEAGTLECLCEFIAVKVGRQFPVAWVEVSRPSTGDVCRVTP